MKNKLLAWIALPPTAIYSVVLLQMYINKKENSFSTS